MTTSCKSKDSPVIRINRAIAVAHASGTKVALEELESLAGEMAVAEYLPLYAALGEMREETGDRDGAIEAFRMTRDLARSSVVRRFFDGKIEA